MNQPTITRSRMVVVVWHALVLLMLAWMITRPREGDLHWIWIPVLATPALALMATFLPMLGRHRAVAYWVLAVITIPSAVGGIASLVGPTFIVSILILIWAARRENPASEMVQA